MKFSKLTKFCLLAICLPSLTPSAQAGKRQDHLQDQIKAGKYIAILSDCGACHTLENQPEFSGGLPFAIPTGIIYATNITPDLTYGIGNYSEADFSRAVREGIRKDGKPLYPAMPYPSYAHLSDEDIHNLYLYFTKEVLPVSQPVPKEKMFWPFNIRWPLNIWRYFFLPKVTDAQHALYQQSQDSLIERGAYLAEGPGHCGACHTPRDIGLEEKALEERKDHLFLSGGKNMEGWDAPNLRQDKNAGLKNWTQQDLEMFLKTGRSPKGHVFGSMTEVIQKSTSLWKKEDIKALSAFLLSLPPLNEEDREWDVQQAMLLHKHSKFTKGRQIYVDRCAACHGSEGKGYGMAFPPLAGNPIVMAPNTASLIHIVEKGSAVPALPPQENSSLTMPGFDEMLSDSEISNVLTYIRSAWGNQAKFISVRQVTKLRKELPDTPPPPSPLN
ncbi:cytochrome c [Acetobacteraceae bacterium]|nr:cytochrome c [Acetobacteraceae bacterium]